MSREYSKHYSVLKTECIDYLLYKDFEEGLFLDCTFGGGGHSFALLEKSSKIKVLATDQDPEAYANGLENINRNKYSERITLIKTNFSNFPQYHAKNNLPALSGVLIDLGISSHHVDDAKRGFSFKSDAALDMRMDNDNPDKLTAEDIINSYSKDELFKIFDEYGEEKFAKKIADKIVEERRIKRIKTTKDLENIIFHCYPPKLRHMKRHPATLCFQALRIEVNQELEVIKNTIPKLFDLLMPGGRMAIISFHSLEDRIVKHTFKSFIDKAKILTKKPIVPSEQEIIENLRSRSAKLRVIEKI